MAGALTERITAYLSVGGLFNPEMAEHVHVRDLLIACREALLPLAAHDQKVRAEVLEEAANEAKKYGLGHEGDSIAAAIRRLRFPVAPAASKPEAGNKGAQ